MTCCRAIVLALLPWSLARADHYEVYILAGQSNAGGHGYASRQFSQFSPAGDDGLLELGKSSYLAPQPDTLFIHWRGGTPNAGRPVSWEARSDGWIPMKAGYSLYGYNSSSPQLLGTETVNHPFGAEVTFAERIREGRSGRKVAIIKYSHDIATLANAGHCYRGLLDLVSQSLATLAGQGHTHELRGILWHQGESDSGLSTAVYKDRLKEFIGAIRTDLGKPQLLFLIGELIQSGYANTRSAQRQAAAETSNAFFISSVALRGDSTTIHFDTTGQLDFGRRYAERMLQSGPPMRRTIAQWKLDETTLPWTGAYAPIPDAAGGTDGVLFGYAEADQTVVDGTVTHREGPGGGADRAYDFAPDSGISGVNTNRPDALPATGDFTLLVWMRTTDPHASQGHLFSNNNGQASRANLHLVNGSLQWFHKGGVTLTESNSPVFDGKWHRVGVMRKGNDWSLLRDGMVVATGNSAATIGQDTEWMIGRMRAFNGNFEGMIGDVTVLNHAITDPLEIESSQLVPGGTCQLAWSSQPGFEYGIEWSPDLEAWNFLRVVPSASGATTQANFPDPAAGPRLFLRIR